ncbi:hypothetical protein FRC02_001177 [Tulasnella sp. 418]|nr:hypothetical protein FRC02_001177 [Tulasnella sp. 418]
MVSHITLSINTDIPSTNWSTGRPPGLRNTLPQPAATNEGCLFQQFKPSTLQLELICGLRTAVHRLSGLQSNLKLQRGEVHPFNTSTYHISYHSEQPSQL